MRKRADIPFEAIFEETGLLLVALDQEGRVVLFNAALEKLSGYSSEEAIGRSIWDFAIPEEAREVDIVYLERFRQGELVDTLEQHMLTKDGRKRLVSWRATTAGAGKGQPDIIVAVGMDITERRLAEQTMASSEGFFRMLIENALDLVTVLGSDGRVVYAGPSVERLLGYEQEEIIGRKIMEFIHPDDISAARAALDFAMSRPGVTGDIELRIRHRDGGWRIHEASSFNLLDNPGIQGMVINSRDITERKEAEEKLSLRSREIEAVFQSLPDLFFRFTSDGTILDYGAGQLHLSLRAARRVPGQEGTGRAPAGYRAKDYTGYRRGRRDQEPRHLRI